MSTNQFEQFIEVQSKEFGQIQISASEVILQMVRFTEKVLQSAKKGYKGYELNISM